MIDPPCLIDCQHTMRLFQEIFAGSQNGFISGENGFVRSVPMKPVHGIESRPGVGCAGRGRMRGAGLRTAIQVRREAALRTGLFPTSVDKFEITSGQFCK
jgi:hypothetical protein